MLAAVLGAGVDGVDGAGVGAGADGAGVDGAGVGDGVGAGVTMVKVDVVMFAARDTPVIALPTCAARLLTRLFVTVVNDALAGTKTSATTATCPTGADAIMVLVLMPAVVSANARAVWLLALLLTDLAVETSVVSISTLNELPERWRCGAAARKPYVISRRLA